MMEKLNLILLLICVHVVFSQETIFDRKVTLYDELLEPPVISRFEEVLDIHGRYELVGDVNLWVEQIGEGIPMVLISGGPGTSHHYFHPHYSNFRNAARIVYYDMRGVGLSDYERGSSGYSIMQAVEDLERLRQKLGYQKWVINGLSFGGVIAQMYALKYPEHLLGMVMVSSALPMSIDIGLGKRQFDFLTEEEQDKIRSIYSIGGRRVRPVHSDEVSQKLQRSMLFNAFMNGDWKRRHVTKWTEDDIARYVRYEFVHDKDYYAEMLQDYFRYDLKDLFKTCPIPTLIIEGEWDLAYSETKPGVMKSQFPKAQYILISDAGHVPWEEKPNEFFDILRDFIQNSAKAPEKGQLISWKTQIASAEIAKENKSQDADFNVTKKKGDN